MFLPPPRRGWGIFVTLHDGTPSSTWLLSEWRLLRLILSQNLARLGLCARKGQISPRFTSRNRTLHRYSQMWSLPGLNVESYVELLRSRRSRVVAHRPLGPLVHLSQLSGPVRSFFSLFCLFSGISVPCRGAVVGFGCVGRFSGADFGFSGALKPTVRVYCRRRVRAVCLVGRCPWCEAVGEDVPASRLVTLGPGRRGGLLGLGSFDPDGFFDVVSDG